MHSRYEYANNFGNITNRVCVITFDNSLTIEVFACLLQTQVGQILQHLRRTLSQFPPTNCIIRYLIRPIPKFNKNINYSMTEFCSIFYILKSMFWFYFNCFCLQLTTKLKMIKKNPLFSGPTTTAKFNCTKMQNKDGPLNFYNKTNYVAFISN